MTSYPAPAIIARHYPCPCCGAILGYVARIGPVGSAGLQAAWLHVYAYPPRSIVERMDLRRIVARILDGDVYCPYCCEWQQYQPTLPGASNGRHRTSRP